MFEEQLGDNLYKLWNRHVLGQLLPAAGQGRADSKEVRGRRGCWACRPSPIGWHRRWSRWSSSRCSSPAFDRDSFGYRPGRSALDAVALVRRRSWEYDWVVEFDIKGLFDNIDHALLLRAVRKHCRTPWVLLYIERWLKAPMETAEGTLVARDRGTPQGGVVESAAGQPLPALRT